MESILKNHLMSVKINSTGAEAVEIRRLDLDCSYLWGGDAAYWGSHSPVLFPMVCAAMNGEIKVDNQHYAMMNHGYARKTEFELFEQSETTAAYRLQANEKSLAMYPFKFQLTLHYSLVENSLKIDYFVKNIDEKAIYFQIGTHPGFNCPLEKDRAFEDYYLEFSQPEILERHYMNTANVLIADKTTLIGEHVSQLPMTRSLFADGALVFPEVKSNRIVLKSDLSPRAVAVTYQNMNQLGIWQAKDAPFVCIEPWHGLADVDGYTGEFKDREAVIQLAQGETFHCSM
ncbi:MAG: aldose 1-epimerase family protein, partial [Eubacteriales bacterium]|nr:aldose 1-epimerase family protein [Eubacteriales bacterium]